MAAAGADDSKGASYLDAFAAFRDEVRMDFFLTYLGLSRSGPAKEGPPLTGSLCLLPLGIRRSVSLRRMQQRRRLTWLRSLPFTRLTKTC